jgi:multidrug efflux system outer membrane protein
MRKLVLASTFGLGALFAGCAVGPNYKAPLSHTGRAFGRAETNRFVAATPEVRWWALFNDETLNDLVRRAAESNHDVRIAQARLDESRALRRGALWAFAPQGAVSGGFERRRFSARETAGFGIPPATGNTWSTGFDATWEIDVFGRLRRGAEATAAEIGSAQADLRNIQVALLAEVAANYFSLRGAQNSKALLNQQLALQQRSLETTRTRVAAGRGSQLDIARVEALLKETEAALPLSEREAQEHLHRLGVLLGEDPGSFSVSTAPNTGDVTAHNVAIGTPAELLRRRPDIAAAERKLAAATAMVGVRTAEMFPEVSISGFIRFIGGEGVSVGSAASQAWSVAPTATWHVLSLGRLNASRRASQFRAEGALASFEQTVLRALEDVENAIVRYRAAEERLNSLVQRQAAAESAFRIAQAQYSAGAVSALEAIDAERIALASARDTVRAATEQRLSVIAINKALGGGWEDELLFALK